MRDFQHQNPCELALKRIQNGRKPKFLFLQRPVS